MSLDIGRTAKSITGIIGEHPRERNDFYSTPDSAIRALLNVERFAKNFWEPACGDGAICKVASDEYQYAPIGTDLVARGYGIGGVDFLMERKLLGPDIITNPPFRLAVQFLEHALDLGAEKIAFCLRLQFLEGQRRLSLLKRLARVYVFSKRIPRMHNPDYDGPKTTSLMAFAWFVWDRAPHAEPILRWIVPVELKTE